MMEQISNHVQLNSRTSISSKYFSAIEKKAHKTSSKLHEGKFKDKKDKKRLQKILWKVMQCTCPYSARRSCGQPIAPSNITMETICDIRGIIKLQKEDAPKCAAASFGFIDAKDQLFYFQCSSLIMGGFILPITRVIFGLSPAPFAGGSWVARNI